MRRRTASGLVLVAAGIAVVVATALGAAGKLTPIDAEVDGEDGVDGLANDYGVAVSPDGDHVYSLGASDHAIASFTRAGTGRLEFLELDRDGENGVDSLQNPSALVLSPDGKFVYVASSVNNAVAWFKRNRQTGELSFRDWVEHGVDGVEGLDGPCCQIAMSPNGRTLYASAADSGSVAAFKRNPDTGVLTFLEAESSTETPSLAGAIGVTVSPDGKNVYAIGENDKGVGALVTFKRRRRGRLELLNVRRDDVGRNRGLGDPCCNVEVSPNGRTVYVPGTGDHAITAFTRSPWTGKVSFLATYRDGARGITHMQDPEGLAVSPDNKSVYVGSYADDSLLTFARRRSGRLSFRSVRTDDVEVETDLLGGVWRVAVAPDGRSVYAGAYADHAVVAFKRER